MKVHELFEEVQGAYLYHLTDVAAILNMLEDHRFALSSEKNYPMKFFSLATSTKSGYFSFMTGPDSAMLVINRAKLTQEFKLDKHVNADGATALNSVGVYSNEHEVRITGNSDYVHFSSYSIFSEIRILRMPTRSKGTDYYTDEQFEKLTELCEANNIRLRVVTTKAEFRKSA